MSRKKCYVILTDPDDPREGEVRLGGQMGEDHWEGGQLIFTWKQHVNRGGPPTRVERIVKLANQALEEKAKEKATLRKPLKPWQVDGPSVHDD